MELHNENRLVPGQARPPTLGKLSKLATGKPHAPASPPAAAMAAVPPARRLRIRRASSGWVGALAMGAVLAAVSSLVMLDRSGALPGLAGRGEAQAPPDAGLGAEDKARYWALAGYEPARFAKLMGVAADEPARLEEDARKLERLLSERSPRQER